MEALKVGIVLIILFLSDPGFTPASARIRPAKKQVVTLTSPRSAKARTKHLSRLSQEFQKQGLTWGAKIYLRVFKHSRELELWVENSGKYHLFKTYPICYFSGIVGPKQRRGDGQTPEGFYYVTPGQLNPFSSYHLSFDVGYPNAVDRYHRRTGGNIMIHGACVSIGCLAMTNSQIEEIYTLVDSSLRQGNQRVPVHIFPFRMSLLNRWRFVRYDWQDFWNQLEPVYDYFEDHRQLPTIQTKRGRYLIE